MSLFVIADLHLSLSVDKPMDIFGGWNDYMQRIEENWCKVVKENDTVVIPGDISWGMNFKEAEKDFEFLNNLPGRKIISKGNHDYWWNTVSKMTNFFNEKGFSSINILHNNHYQYENLGICGTRGWINETNAIADKKVLLREAGRLTFSIESALKQDLKPIVFLHYPPIFANDQNLEILEVLHKYGIKHCFYGHIHGRGCKNAFNGVSDGIHYQLISSDYLHFAPLDITDFVQNDNL
ncbi:MAG: serine/threonine protein phosphatase [Clostridiales bacterium]|nr:serine/threonine protein phosphatase [Clostridiales bacterium]